MFFFTSKVKERKTFSLFKLNSFFLFLCFFFCFFFIKSCMKRWMIISFWNSFFLLIYAVNNNSVWNTSCARVTTCILSVSCNQSCWAWYATFLFADLTESNMFTQTRKRNQNQTRKPNSITMGNSNKITTLAWNISNLN